MQWTKQIEERLIAVEKLLENKPSQLLQKSQDISEELQKEIDRKELISSLSRLELLQAVKQFSDEDLRVIIANLEYEMRDRKLNCQFCDKSGKELVKGIGDARICLECLSKQAKQILEEEEEKQKKKRELDEKIANEPDTFKKMRMTLYQSEDV